MTHHKPITRRDFLGALSKAAGLAGTAVLLDTLGCATIGRKAAPTGHAIPGLEVPNVPIYPPHTKSDGTVGYSTYDPHMMLVEYVKEPGTHVLLNFWGACGSAENDDIKKITEKYHGRLAVLGARYFDPGEMPYEDEIQRVAAGHTVTEKNRIYRNAFIEHSASAHLLMETGISLKSRLPINLLMQRTAEGSMLIVYGIGSLCKPGAVEEIMGEIDKIIGAQRG
ncbi:MAG: hypothetical protein ACP5NX_02645 [Candidatus Bilamarchaeaceae archaeon]